MFGLGFRTPLAPFEPANTLGTDEIRPRARHRSGLLIAVEINQHFPFHSFHAHFAIKIHYQLIAPLHEVDLDPSDASLLVLIECANQLIV